MAALLTRCVEGERGQRLPEPGGLGGGAGKGGGNREGNKKRGQSGDIRRTMGPVGQVS